MIHRMFPPSLDPFIKQKVQKRIVDRQTKIAQFLVRLELVKNLSYIKNVRAHPSTCKYIHFYLYILIRNIIGDSL
jgi:hypothetical protein